MTLVGKSADAKICLVLTVLLLLVAVPPATHRHVDSEPSADRESQLVDPAYAADRRSGMDAMQFRRLQMLSEDGTINAENWLRAREHVNTLRRAASQFEPHSISRKLAGGLDPMSWESIGPGNIGGRIRSLVFDPDDPRRLYVGGVSGGIWLSNDGGESWAPADDFMDNLSVTSLVFDPLDSNVMYAGTGEIIRGMGIFRSTDRGVTWTSLESTRGYAVVTRLAFLNDGSRLLAATSFGIVASEDGGDTWTTVYTPCLRDIDAPPVDPELLFAGGISGG